MNLARIFFIVFVGESLIALYAIYLDGFTLTGLQSTTRFSGRLSLAIFSLVFLLHNKRGNLVLILLGRPYHFFAFAHGIHLLELLAFVYFSGYELNPVRIAGGFVAYLFIFIMPFIVDRSQTGKISLKAFSTIQVIFLYYIWFIFFMTYLPRVRGTLPNVGGNYWEHVALLGWVTAMLGMKITSMVRFGSTTTR